MWKPNGKETFVEKKFQQPASVYPSKPFLACAPETEQVYLVLCNLHCPETTRCIFPWIEEL